MKQLALLALTFLLSQIYSLVQNAASQKRNEPPDLLLTQQRDLQINIRIQDSLFGSCCSPHFAKSRVCAAIILLLLSAKPWDVVTVA